jgi:hypothetical protein
MGNTIRAADPRVYPFPRAAAIEVRAGSSPSGKTAPKTTTWPPSGKDFSPTIESCWENGTEAGAHPKLRGSPHPNEDRSAVTA